MKTQHSQSKNKAKQTNNNKILVVAGFFFLGCIIKYAKPVGLNNRNELSDSSPGCKSKLRHWQQWVSSRAVGEDLLQVDGAVLHYIYTR